MFRSRYRGFDQGDHSPDEGTPAQGADEGGGPADGFVGFDSAVLSSDRRHLHIASPEHDAFDHRLAAIGHVFVHITTTTG